MTEVLKPPSFVWVYPAAIDRVQDGDSVIMHVMLHPNEGGVAHELNVRIEGINAPELSTAAGKAAKAYAETLLTQGLHVTLTARKKEKFGRFLGRITMPNGDDFSTAMIAAGHAVAYLT